MSKRRELLSTNRTLLMIWAAFFVTLAVLVPTIFHAVGGLGKVFLPMHIPVILCGFICGPYFGLLCGIIAPILSSMITGMPVLIPNGIIMAFELACYGFVSGFLYGRGRAILTALAAAMISGRIISGILTACVLGFAGKTYGLSAFVTASFLTGLPGIVIQLVLIPVLVKAMEKLIRHIICSGGDC